MKNFLRKCNVSSSVCSCDRQHLHPTGFSLIEVIMATAILMGSVVMLSRLSGIGRTHAQNTRQQAQVQRICENTMNEIVMGLRPMVAVEAGPLLPMVAMLEEELELEEIEQDQVILPGQPQDQLLTANNAPRWIHSIRFMAHEEIPSLVSLTVHVAAARQSGTRRIHFSLTRWVRRKVQPNPFSDFGGELQ